MKTDHKFGRSTSPLADICQAPASCALIFMPYSTAPWLQKVHLYLPYWVQGRLGQLPVISVCRDEGVKVSKELFILEAEVGLHLERLYKVVPTEELGIQGQLLGR